MKIFFILSSFPKLSETFILNQITGLMDMGHDIEVFAGLDPKEPKEHEDVIKYRLRERTHYLPKSKPARVTGFLKNFFSTFIKAPAIALKALNVFRYGKEALGLRLFYLIKPLLKKDFDIIHCHFGPNGSTGAILKEIGVKGKVVTTFHGFDVNSYPKVEEERGSPDCYGRLFKNGDLFMANTNFTRKQVLSLGCDSSKTAVLPVGLNIERFKFSERKISAGEDVKILTTGRLVEKKGHEYAIRAVVKAAKAHKNIRYTIAGDGPLRERLLTLVKELGADSFIEFIGPVNEEEALKLYSEAHIFLLPSITAADEDREGQALVLQEAQACGIPVLSTFHNGIPEGVIDKVSAFLVPERNSDALAERLSYLITNPEIWSEMGRKGRKFVEAKYDIRRLNEELTNMYEYLCQGDYASIKTYSYEGPSTSF